MWYIDLRSLFCSLSQARYPPIPLEGSATQGPSVLRLLLYARNVLFRHRVPGLHILFHARGEAGFLAFREGRAGLGDAAFEAVLVQFLQNKVSHQS
jgi:hypothetical protein